MQSSMIGPLLVQRNVVGCSALYSTYTRVRRTGSYSTVVLPHGCIEVYIHADTSRYIHIVAYISITERLDQCRHAGKLKDIDCSSENPTITWLSGNLCSMETLRMCLEPINHSTSLLRTIQNVSRGLEGKPKLNY